MEKLKTTLLNLFGIAYRARCSLPLLVSTAFMFLGLRFRIGIELEVHPLDQEDEAQEAL